jgi:hypothetical protein
MTKPRFHELPDPTADQCSERAAIECEEGTAYACWYPQMGGYSSSCLVLLEPSAPDRDGHVHYCFSVRVWHECDW